MSTTPTGFETPVLSALENRDVIQLASTLGKLLAAAPEYQAFLAALKEVNNDPEVRRISLQIRDHNQAIQWGKGNPATHQSARDRLTQELENLPCLRAYRQYEAQVIDICRQLDRLISQEAGVAFGQNAKSSGCGCGS